ncbi:hemerythrin domain-containing protein [Antarcticibacterium flavum]|uniref:Hemerythrin domain-containing protein n=1 Tax=Antarcticibacterium flavum TaxID=2058175 RepID=A0A5B7X3J1_9FLAO|nr:MULTISPECIES: hemerythrin domain-containing protein [Antarcticibacterium]MCM4158279.1 cation-binding protein [Antarcticibacterium sp. W02-3]QCY70046.1 hemerythrin domain-containing protein [Antarcticibacterium flavum]
MTYNSKITAKTSSFLKPVMQEHEQALQLCERIRMGLRNEVDLLRIRAYTDWFLTTYLEPHFEIEEKYIFPILGSNARVKRALANHRRIRKLLSCSCENEKVLNLLEEELASHIRFEENVLFREISRAGKLVEIKKLHQAAVSPNEEWEDRFWQA